MVFSGANPAFLHPGSRGLFHAACGIRSKPRNMSAESNTGYQYKYDKQAYQPAVNIM